MPRNTLKNSKKSKSKSKSHSNKVLYPLFNINNFLKLKYSSDPYTFSYLCIKNLIFNEKCRIVSRFKDFLVLDDGMEFLNKFYNKNEQKKRLIKILEFYDKYNKVFPNYMILPENEYIYKNLRKKQKMINIQNDNLNQEKKDKKGLHLDNASVFSIFFTNKIDESINKKKDSFFSSKIIDNKLYKNYINNESCFSNSKVSLSISCFSKREILLNENNISPTSPNMIINSNNYEPSTFRDESSVKNIVSLLNTSKNKKNISKNNEACCTPKKKKKNPVKVSNVPKKSLNNNKQFFCHKKNISDIYGIKNVQSKRLLRSKFINQNKIGSAEPITPIKNVSKFKFQKSLKKNSNKKNKKQYFNENEKNNNKENEMIRSNLFFQLNKKIEKLAKIIIDKDQNNLITISNSISSNINTININSTNSNTNTDINFNKNNENKIYDYNGNYKKYKIIKNDCKGLHSMKNQIIETDLEIKEKNNNDIKKKKTSNSNKNNNRENNGRTKVRLTKKILPNKKNNMMNLNYCKSRQLTENYLEISKTQNENLNPNIKNNNRINVTLSSNIKMSNKNLTKTNQLFHHKKIEVIKEKFNQNQKKKILKKYKTDSDQIYPNKLITKINTNNKHNSLNYNSNNFQRIQISNLRNIHKKNSASIGRDKNKSSKIAAFKKEDNKKLQCRNIIINNNIKDIEINHEFVSKYHKLINDNPNLHLSYIPYVCNTNYQNNTIDGQRTNEINLKPKHIKINCIKQKNRNFKSPLHKRINAYIKRVMETPGNIRYLINNESSSINKNINIRRKFIFIQDPVKHTNSVKSTSSSIVKKFMRNNFVTK